MDFTEKLHDIDRRRAQLNAYRPLTEGEQARLNEDFTIEFTYNSNAIEGNTMTLDETALVLREGVTIDGKSLREHLELVGHRDACMFVEDLVRNPEPLSEKHILDIHSLVLMHRREDRGVYRRMPVTIMGADVVLPQPWAVPVEMERLLQEYHGFMKDMHPVERAALFHLRFESVHPFIDGNGRTGRLLMNLELMKDGYPPIDVKYTDRKAYINCFRAWQSGAHETAPMAELIADYVSGRLDDMLNLLEQIPGEGPEKDM